MFERVAVSGAVVVGGNGHSPTTVFLLTSFDADSGCHPVFYPTVAFVLPVHLIVVSRVPRFGSACRIQIFQFVETVGQ